MSAPNASASSAITCVTGGSGLTGKRRNQKRGYVDQQVQWDNPFRAPAGPRDRETSRPPTASTMRRPQSASGRATGPSPKMVQAHLEIPARHGQGFAQVHGHLQHIPNHGKGPLRGERCLRTTLRPDVVDGYGARWYSIVRGVPVRWLVQQDAMSAATPRLGGTWTSASAEPPPDGVVKDPHDECGHTDGSAAVTRRAHRHASAAGVQPCSHVFGRG